ncbi:MAG: diguanylate phosphodiesterase [Pseudomonadaceae bacterium]|nr:diguanylate phosphodiesterase [Pseudomonadaceae bacterium]MBQ57188.1 diguanylate phosphodiesterase [Pseudomonadaceae bacterium]HCP55823.1 diguanylate phosphodiesterase [Pseudomonas sp.]
MLLQACQYLLVVLFDEDSENLFFRSHLRYLMASLSVLVIEDHAFQRAVTVAALKKAGVCEVLETRDGASALTLLREAGGVDIVICDLRMPEMDGLVFLRHAAESGLINSLILSCEVDASLRNAVVSIIDAFGLNLLGDLSHPFSFEQLEALLGRFDNAGPVVDDLSNAIPLTVDEVIKGLHVGQFKAFYQPKVSLKTGEVKGAEVLARWQHPIHGLISAQQFLPLIEDNDLLDELFWVIIKQGLSLQQSLQANNRHIELSFNLPAQQLGSSYLVDQIKDLVCACQLPLNGLIFEISDLGSSEVPDRGLENLIRLRLMGCGLAMEGFRVGYSSLLNLFEIPFSQVKLDTSFLLSRRRHSSNMSMISSAVALARSLNISLVAGGVETLQQQELLFEMGCDLVQGYLYGKPMPAEQLVINNWSLVSVKGLGFNKYI